MAYTQDITIGKDVTVDGKVVTFRELQKWIDGLPYHRADLNIGIIKDGILWQDTSPITALDAMAWALPYLPHKFIN